MALAGVKEAGHSSAESGLDRASVDVARYNQVQYPSAERTKDAHGPIGNTGRDSPLQEVRQSTANECAVSRLLLG